MPKQVQLVDLFVSKEHAEELNKLGFNYDCFGVYNIFRHLEFGFRIFGTKDIEASILAPTYDQVFKWFRQEKNLYSCIAWITDGYDYFIKKEPGRIVNKNSTYETYRIAEEKCIDHLIEICKSSLT